MKPKFKTVLTALLLAVSLPSMAATHVLMETYPFGFGRVQSPQNRC